MSTNDLLQRLEKIQAKRGYLLPHHGLMALTSPTLLQDYDQLYEQLTLTQGHLTRHLHESVWIAVLSSIDECFGTHHVHKFQQAGGTLAELEAILALSAIARGCGAFTFARDIWEQHLPQFDATRAYLVACEKNANTLDPTLPHLIGIATHTCLRNGEVLEWHLRHAYVNGIDEKAMAEAMLMTMLPGSVPNLVAAASVWRELVVSGDVKASAEIEAWANLGGQGGWAATTER